MMFEEVPFLEDDAAVLLETNLHPACPGPVGTFGIAASSSWHDVYIVSLTCPRHKPETVKCYDYIDKDCCPTHINPSSVIGLVWLVDFICFLIRLRPSTLSSVVFD